MWIRKPRRHLRRPRRPLPWPSPTSTRSASRVYAFVETGRRRQWTSQPTPPLLFRLLSKPTLICLFSPLTISLTLTYSFSFFPFPHGCLFLHSIVLCIDRRGPSFAFAFSAFQFFPFTVCLLCIHGVLKKCAKKLTFCMIPPKDFLFVFLIIDTSFAPFPKHPPPIFVSLFFFSHSLGAATKTLPLRVLRVVAVGLAVIFLLYCLLFPPIFSKSLVYLSNLILLVTSHCSV